MVDFLKKETIIKLINEGIEDEKNGIVKEKKEIDIMENRYRGWYWAVRSYTAGRDIARERWNWEFDLEEKEWERFGLPNVDRNYNEYTVSYNYKDDYTEPGLSVMNDAWKETYGYFESLAKGEKIYKIKGIQIGWGSDGEPVIIPTSEAKEK